MQNTNATAKAVGSDVVYLFQTARRSGEKLIRDALGVVLCASTLHVAQLAALPLWIAAVGAALPLWRLLALIAVMVLVLCGLTVLERIVNDRFEQSRDAFRARGCTALARHTVSLTYPMETDAFYRRDWRAAREAMGQHIHAPIPHIWHTMAQLLIHAVGLVVTAAVLMHVNGWMVAAIAAMSLVSAMVHHAVTVMGERDRDREINADERMATLSSSSRLSAYAKDIRVFGLDAWIGDLFDRTLNAVQALAYRRAKIYMWFSVADALLTVLRGGLAIVLSMDAAMNGTLSPAMWLLWLLCVGGCAQSMSGLLSNGAALQRELGAVSIYRRVMTQPDRFVTEGGLPPKEGPLHTLELRRVGFTAPGQEWPVLHDISFTLHEGERLAIVGEDGAWKDALARLIGGFDDPTEGVILLDGVDVRRLDRRAYYALFAAVFQNSSLPEMTVREMLTAAADHVKEDTLWGILEQVGLDETVRALPQGLDTAIGRLSGGVRLSGGQTARLLLARALCKNADLLILDEPTAALDPLAEHELYQQYDRFTAGKGAVFLSHRAASSRGCDRILYMKHGTVAEEGTHEELLSRGGDYAAFFELQSRYYREGRDPDDEVFG